MALARIKEEYKTKRVAFGNSAAPLHKRDDIDQLAILAHESGDPTLIKLFDFLPELSVLKKAKTEKELGRSAPTEVPVLNDSSPLKNDQQPKKRSRSRKGQQTK